jgi:hypothetical protein
MGGLTTTLSWLTCGASHIRSLFLGSEKLLLLPPGSDSGSAEDRPETVAREGVTPFRGSDFCAGAGAGESSEAQHEIQLGGLGSQSHRESRCHYG